MERKMIKSCVQTPESNKRNQTISLEILSRNKILRGTTFLDESKSLRSSYNSFEEHG